MTEENDSLTEASNLETVDLLTLQRDLYKLENAKLNMQMLELRMKVTQLEVKVRQKELKEALDSSQSQYEQGLKTLCTRYGIDLESGDGINTEQGLISRVAPVAAATEEDED